VRFACLEIVQEVWAVESEKFALSVLRRVGKSLLQGFEIEATYSLLEYL
jgi:hypothetical protein